MYNSGSPFEECHIIVSIQQQSTQNETFIAMNILQYYKILKFIKKNFQGMSYMYSLIMAFIEAWASVQISFTLNFLTFKLSNILFIPSFSILRDFSPTSLLSMTIMSTISLLSCVITVYVMNLAL